MLPFRHWLRRADLRNDPRTVALVLPDGMSLAYADLAATAGAPGLNVLTGGAGGMALGLAACALGGGTAFPLPPNLTDGHRERLVELAGAAAAPALALIVATSGSTGAPKGVRLPWRAVAAGARMSARALGLTPGDAWLACLPLHAVGGAMILYRCWRAGATAVVHDGFDAKAVAHDLARRRITHVSLVPPMLARLLDLGVPPPLTLRCALVGGAALHDTLLARARAAGWPLRLSYGMTETGALAAVDGEPLPGARFRIAANGTLEIATPARMAGYLGERDIGAWLPTRDLGRVDAAGRVTVTGRADDMLVSGGVNIQPADIEARLAACPGVREAAITGIDDPVWGQIVTALYEGEASEASVAAWCRAHLPRTHRPRRLHRVARLPRTASGKLDRRALPALVAP